MTLRPTFPEAGIVFDLVIPSLIAANSKQALRSVAQEIAKMIGIKEKILADRLIDSEKTNPSAMGHGIALLHLPMSSLQNSLNIFVKLKNPVDMAAPDSMPVDILCILLTPEREGASYLRTMARVSRLLRNPQICAKIRATSDEKTIRQTLDQFSTQPMAA